MHSRGSHQRASHLHRKGALTLQRGRTKLLHELIAGKISAAERLQFVAIDIAQRSLTALLSLALLAPAPASGSTPWEALHHDASFPAYATLAQRKVAVKQQNAVGRDKGAADMLDRDLFTQDAWQGMKQ